MSEIRHEQIDCMLRLTLVNSGNNVVSNDLADSAKLAHDLQGLHLGLYGLYGCAGLHVSM